MRPWETDRALELPLYSLELRALEIDRAISHRDEEKKREQEEKEAERERGEAGGAVAVGAAKAAE